MKRNLALLVAAILIAVLVIPVVPVLADQSYHTERLPLMVTEEGNAAGQTLRNGMVVNAHPNGPVVGAVEKYVLNGANPNTAYSVYWDVIFGGNPVGQIPTGITVQTDNRGNGNSTYRIPRSLQIEMGLTNIELTLRWLFIVDGVVAFQTDWTTVNID